MSIRALVNEDLDAVLELYEHLHESDSPLPERQRVQSVWSEALASSIRICMEHEMLLSHAHEEIHGRSLLGFLIHSARAVIRHMNRNSAPVDWLEDLMKRRHHNVVIAALANKLARTIRALLSKEQSYKRCEDTVVS